MVKMYMRSKKRFPSARRAWMDIARRTGLRPNQVRSRHTRRRWIWIRK